MKEIFLVIVFNIGGVPYIDDDGWAPMAQQTYESCDVRAEQLYNYVTSQDNLPPLYGIYCGTPEEVRTYINE